MPYELFPKTAIITVQNIPMTILNLDQREYISLPIWQRPAQIPPEPQM